MHRDKTYYLIQNVDTALQILFYVEKEPRTLEDLKQPCRYSFTLKKSRGPLRISKGIPDSRTTALRGSLRYL